MAQFHLQIVTPDGLFYDGQAESVTVPTVDGAVTILARHIDYLSALGMGEARGRGGRQNAPGRLHRRHGFCHPGRGQGSRHHL